MPITPSKNSTNTWIISYSFTEDGEYKVLTEEFKGSIKDAMFYEKQLREALSTASRSR